MSYSHSNGSHNCFSNRIFWSLTISNLKPFFIFRFRIPIAVNIRYHPAILLAFLLLFFVSKCRIWWVPPWRWNWRGLCKIFSYFLFRWSGRNLESIFCIGSWSLWVSSWCSVNCVILQRCVVAWFFLIRYPYVTGSSVLAIKYKYGILMAADTGGLEFFFLHFLLLLVAMELINI